jgi:glycogen operon protein
MKLKTKVGDFQQFGVQIKNGYATFTFEVNSKKDPSLVLIDRETKKKERIVLDSSYRYGRVYSVSISGIDYNNMGYLIEEDGSLELDPYAERIIGREIWNDEKRKKDDFKVFCGFRSNLSEFKDESPSLLTSEYIIYRMHMRGFTMDHSLAEEKRGNYLGVIQRLSYLSDLGVNAIEFQPLYDFEECFYEEKRTIDKKGRTHISNVSTGRVNYWGYAKASYFAPKASYFGGEEVDKNMRKMVHAIHKKGMKIIMEMSFEEGVSSDLVIDCLKYWNKVYHVDGFHIIGLSCPIERIVNDPYLSDVNIFYDNYPNGLLDSENGYNRHLFVNDTAFMYPLRKLTNHKDGSIIEFTNMMRRQNERYGFVNFAASTSSGFTLLDSFSYKEKHNEANGEENRDGNNFNFSDNYGTEGETNSRLLWDVRLKNCRTSLAATIFSQGIPLIQSGDEVLNSQNGNNNPYCQDNKIGWVNFNNRKRTREFRDYVKKLIKFRKAHTVLSSVHPKDLGDPKHFGLPDLSYHGREPWTVWLSEDRKAVGIMYAGVYSDSKKEDDVMLLFNFYLEAEEFALPTLLKKRKWFFVTNTGDNKWLEKEELLNNQEFISVPGGTLTILIGKTEK